MRYTGRIQAQSKGHCHVAVTVGEEMNSPVCRDLGKNPPILAVLWEVGSVLEDAAGSLGPSASVANPPSLHCPPRADALEWSSPSLERWTFWRHREMPLFSTPENTFPVNTVFTVNAILCPEPTFYLFIYFLNFIYFIFLLIN